MSKGIIFVIIIVVVALGVWAFTSKTATAPQNGMQMPPAVNQQMPTAPAVKEFIVTGSSFSFAPNTLAVKKGDRVRIVFKNAEGFHDWKLDEFGVATKQLKVGESETIEFIADKAGTFEYYCSVGKHRAMGMKGILTVTE
ncbi:MAG: cupredoxin domain-containing protein [Patescibacteria group bacterium]